MEPISVDESVAKCQSNMRYPNAKKLSPCHFTRQELSHRSFWEDNLAENTIQAARFHMEALDLQALHGQKGLVSMGD